MVAAAAVAFGFVYIHPFEDGNGRLHRWRIHHVLARAGFRVEQLYADYDKSPYGSKYPGELIFVAGKMKE